MKKIVLLAVIGLGTALFTGCGKDTGTNVSGVHDTVRIYYGDTTGGLVWNVRPSIPAGISSIIWGGSAFVAVGYNRSSTSGMVFTSPDGITWTEQTVGTIPTLNDVVWAQNTYVAVGNPGMSGTIITSSDGTVWTAQTPSVYLTRVVYGANKFIAFGFDSVILTSPDGTAWTLDTANITFGDNTDIAWGNNRFVAASDDSVYTSTDGLTWTNTGVPGGGYQVKVLWADSLFVEYSYNLLTSPDGLTWTDRGSVLGSIFRVGGIAWGNGKFVITQGDWCLTSLDGAVWNLEYGCPLGDNSPWSLAYGDGKFVAVNGQGAVMTSDW